MNIQKGLLRMKFSYIQQHLRGVLSISRPSMIWRWLGSPKEVLPVETLVGDS